MPIKGRDAIKEYIKKYAGGGVDYFQLKNDGDSAKVRFLHSDDQDLELYLVHEVEIDGKRKWVECLEDGCPLCERSKPVLKLFLLLYDYSDEKIKCWERGVTMVDFMLGFIDKYGPLNNRDYEIVRHGKKNDNKTTYQLFAVDEKGPIRDSKGNIIEMPQRPKVLGRFVLHMTKEEMEDYVEFNQPIERSERRERSKGPGF